MACIKQAYLKGLVLIIFIGFLSFAGVGCSDVDGVDAGDALSAESVCQTTTQTFEVSVVGLGNLQCTQTALKDSTLIGLLLLSGVDINPADINAFQACQGQLLLDIACSDPNNVLVFHETCTIEQPKPICTTEISPDEILLNAIANALGLSVGDLDNEQIQNALEVCGVNSDTPLLSLTDAQVECIIDNLQLSTGT